MADVARLALQIDVTGAGRAKSAMASILSESTKLTRATDAQVASQFRLQSTFQATARSGRTMAGAFRLQKGAIQQAGFQIGDFATQVSAGQSAIVAFGQQASQLAGVMGPGGALLGAVIAIGSGIAGAFARSMMTGADSTETLTEKTRELVKELGEATARQREFINTGFQQEIAEQDRIVREAQRTIEVTTGRLEDFRRAAGENVPEAVFQSNGAVQSLLEKMEQARLVIDNAESSTEAIAKAQREFWEAVEETGNKTGDTTDKLGDMVSNLQAQAETIGMSARETAIYEANRLGANAADREAINNAFDQIEAEKQRQQQLKETQQQEQALQKIRSQLDPAGAEFNRYADQIDAIESFNISAREKEQLREEAFRQHQEKMAQIAQQGSNSRLSQLQQFNDARAAHEQQTNNQIMQLTANAIGTMRNLTEEGSQAWVAMTIAQKGIMVAQAIMAANLAAAQTLSAMIIPGVPASVPAAFAAAETTRALGLANAGLIAAQGITELAGARAMGGQVQSGRSYLVGERGPEIVTMGGTGYVTPNHRMGSEKEGQQGTIININNAPAGTRTERRRDNEGREVVDVFIADMASGGPMSKSIGNTFGVRRQGR